MWDSGSNVQTMEIDMVEQHHIDASADTDQRMEKSAEWHPIPFDTVPWHELMRRVRTGTADYDDMMHVKHHLGMQDCARSISLTGGNACDAAEIQTNLHCMRKRRLAQYGFREVHRG